MEMNTRLITLYTLTKHRSLRLKPSFYDFILDKWQNSTNNWRFNYRIRDVIKSIRNGKDVKKDEYSFYETEYFYLTVNNIKPYEFSFNNKIFLSEKAGEKLKNVALNTNDLIITRSGTVGISKLFNIENSSYNFIPSGYLIILTIDDSKINPIWLEYYLNNKFIREYFQVFSSGKTQNNLSQYDILNLPVINIDQYRLNNLLKKLEVFENKIEKVNKKIETVQGIIDDVFNKNGIKKSCTSSYRVESLLTNLKYICRNKAIRIGAEYNDFWINYKGCLFEGADEKIDLLSLKRILDSSVKCNN